MSGGDKEIEKGPATGASNASSESSLAKQVVEIPVGLLEALLGIALRSPEAQVLTAVQELLVRHHRESQMAHQEPGKGKIPHA